MRKTIFFFRVYMMIPGSQRTLIFQGSQEIIEKLPYDKLSLKMLQINAKEGVTDKNV